MTAQPLSDPAPMSEGARIAGVFFQPDKAFADIVARPRWWVPLILVTLAATGYIHAFSRHVGWERFVRRTIESNSRTMSMPAEQRERIIAKGAQVASVTGLVGGAVWTPVSIALTAGALLLVFKVAMSADLSYARALAVTAYAFLVRGLFAALATLVMFLKNPYDFRLENPLLFNIGAFLDPERTPKWLLSGATSADLFDVWIVLLLAAGMAAGKRVSRPKALGGVASLWLVTVAGKAVWAGIWT